LWPVCISCISELVVLAGRCRPDHAAEHAERLAVALGDSGVWVTPTPQVCTQPQHLLSTLLMHLHKACCAHLTAKHVFKVQISRSCHISYYTSLQAARH
jgi:hypothetical protein